MDPESITGRWRDGFTLDRHTIHSEFAGDDEFGYSQFATTRTPIGEALYRFKYQSDDSGVESLVATTVEFIRSKNWILDCVVPVPPSKHRMSQPVVVLAQQIAERLGIPCMEDVVIKQKPTGPLKNVADARERKRLLQAALAVGASTVKGRQVLLFDDLYDSGETMKTAAELLYDKAGVRDVYALALTRTKGRPR
jgi:predicted amidophosphoribosyltransferase